VTTPTPEEATRGEADPPVLPGRPVPADGDEPAGGDDRAAGTEPTGADAGGHQRGRGRRPSRRTLTLVTGPLVVLFGMSWLGGTMAPTLVDTHPALLVALSSSNRHLILTTNQLDPLTYYGIGMLRLLVSDPLFFLLGYWYGDAAVTWMERRTHTWGEMLRTVERYFGKAAYPLVFAFPNNPICLFAGAAGMPLRVFVALNVTGTVTRLYLIRRFGEALQDPIDDFVGWIGDNRVPLLVASIALGLLSVALEAKRGETEVTALTHLDEELEEVERELQEGGGTGTRRSAPDAGRDPDSEADRPTGG
jgi:membrane protein DedA with SNARE-associated domain